MELTRTNRPAGLTTELTVSQLLPSVTADPSVSDADIAQYESAWDAFAAGRWSQALDLLNALPVHDRVKDYLLIYIAQNNYEPPAGWTGCIPLQVK